MDRVFAAARRLGTAASVEDIGASATEAALTLCTAEQTELTVWDAQKQESRVVTVAGVPPMVAARVVGRVVGVSESPELAALVASSDPIVATAAESSDVLRGILEADGMAALIAVPVRSDGRLQGLLIARWRQRLPSPEFVSQSLSRLRGLADLCAVALNGLRALEDARRQAETDALTGLASRQALHRHVVHALTASRPDECAAILYCDIDRFKRTNEWLGHSGGDVVLQEVAARIQRSLSGSGLVARPGGDEFVVLLPRVRHRAEAVQAAERITAALCEPVPVADRLVYARLSIGAATGRLDPGADPARVAEALVSEADRAMYEVKKLRHARPSRHGGQEARIDADLHTAIDQGQITALFQPQVDLATGAVVGCEALARWTHPDLGVLSPGIFIPFAEDNGVIHELGTFMLAHACAIARAAHGAGTPIRVSVNASPRELEDRHYPDKVLAALHEHGLTPPRLTVEVTESTLITNLAAVTRTLQLLRGEGVGVAIDDFGAAYSGLSQLQDLPITELKIDRSFVQRDGAVGASIMKAIVQLANDLDLDVVAEGIETPHQLAAVHSAGAHRGQGFLLGLPASAQRFLHQLQ